MIEEKRYMRGLVTTMRFKIIFAIFLALMPVFSTFSKNEYPSIGYASWYGAEGENGLNYDTAMGVPFCPELYEAASWLPLGTVVRVYCPDTGRSIVIRITDKGPAKRLVKEGRIIDLTRAAFYYLSKGHLEKGLLKVIVTVVKEVM